MKIPEIKFPVYGIGRNYYVELAAEPNSRVLKYRLIGALIFATSPIELSILRIFEMPDGSGRVGFVYIDQTDGKQHESFANKIQEIKQNEPVATETPNPCYAGLHHVSSLYIRKPDKKTFFVKAVKLNRVIRGNARYNIFDANRNEDGFYTFDVANVNRPSDRFEVIAESLQRGEWHMVPGVRYPVPGPDPSEK